MKKKLMIAVSCMMLVANVQVVAASGKDQGIELFSDDGRAVESVFYTEDGEMIVNYTDFQVTVDEPGVTNHFTAKSIGKMARGSAGCYANRIASYTSQKGTDITL